MEQLTELVQTTAQTISNKKVLGYHRFKTDNNRMGTFSIFGLWGEKIISLKIKMPYFLFLIKLNCFFVINIQSLSNLKKLQKTARAFWCSTHPLILCEHFSWSYNPISRCYSVASLCWKYYLVEFWVPDRVKSDPFKSRSRICVATVFRWR